MKRLGLVNWLITLLVISGLVGSLGCSSPQMAPSRFPGGRMMGPGGIMGPGGMMEPGGRCRTGEQRISIEQAAEIVEDYLLTVVTSTLK